MTANDAMPIPSSPDWVTQKEFQEFKTEVKQNFKQIDRQFVRIDQQFKLIDIQFGKVNNRLDCIDDRLDVMEKNFAVHEKSFKMMEKNFQTMEKNSDLRLQSQNELLTARIERSNRRQWAWYIATLIAIATLMVTTR